MTAKVIEGWAAYHPEDGFIWWYGEGAIVHTDLDQCVEDVKELNDGDKIDPGSPRWKAVKVRLEVKDGRD